MNRSANLPYNHSRLSCSGDVWFSLLKQEYINGFIGSHERSDIVAPLLTNLKTIVSLDNHSDTTDQNHLVSRRLILLYCAGALYRHSWPHVMLGKTQEHRLRTYHIYFWTSCIMLSLLHFLGAPTAHPQTCLCRLHTLLLIPQRHIATSRVTREVKKPIQKERGY